MIRINGKFYDKKTIIMIDNVVQSDDTAKGFWMFSLLIDLFGERHSEFIYSKQEDKVFIEQTRSNIVKEINEEYF